MNETETLYLNFVSARHQAYVMRREGTLPPWTADPVLQERKFTNVFRFLDYGSQFVIRELLYSEEIQPEDALLRCYLYRYTNRPEPWEAFHNRFGRYPVVGDLKEILPMAWGGYKADGGKIFGGAYRMFVGKENAGKSRLDWILEVAADVFLETRFTRHYFRQETLQDRIAVMQAYIPRCRDFMSMQIATDMGYSPWHVQTENDFVLPGPGCIAGSKFLGKPPAEAIKWGIKNISPNVHLVLADGSTRRPSMMDVQNTLCEFSKYWRYHNAGPTGRPYRPAHDPQLPPPVYPPHWNRSES